jgi:hypothetical protein
METDEDGTASYSITVNAPDKALGEVLDLYKDRKFESARHAVTQLRDNLNHRLYMERKG